MKKKIKAVLITFLVLLLLVICGFAAFYMGLSLIHI